MPLRGELFTNFKLNNNFIFRLFPLKSQKKTISDQIKIRKV